MYGVDVDTIKAMNPHLGRESALQIGESVFIPGRAEKLLSSKHSYLKRTKKKSSGKSTPGTIRSPGTIQAPRKSSVKKGSKVNTQKETSSAAQKKQINTDSREKINYSLGKKGPVSFLMPMQNSRASVLYGEGKGVFANGIVVQSPSDDKVRAVSAGTVEYAGQVDKLGEVIIISHSKNFFSLYADVKRPLVVLGETMQAGEPVAVAKDSFDSAGKRVFSVYFELRSNDDPVNPMSLISH
jgi:septal ring factor EnvC (AmiA/AmiB activator)